MTTSLRIVPANEASWDDLQAIFGLRGASSRCWCQRFKLARGESFGNTPAEDRAWRLRQQTACEDPASKTTSPIWSKNTNGPTMRRCAEGSARRTLKPSPRSRVGGRMTISTPADDVATLMPLLTLAEPGPHVIQPVR